MYMACVVGDGDPGPLIGLFGQFAHSMRRVA
jgi:hypothetical protein